MKKQLQSHEYPFFNLGGTNSTIGEAWVNNWCGRCYRNPDKCLILTYAIAGYDYKHKLVRKDGEDVCLQFKDKDTYVPKRRYNRKQRTIFDVKNSK